MIENDKKSGPAIKAEEQASDCEGTSQAEQTLETSSESLLLTAERMEPAVVLAQIASDVDLLRKADEKREREAHGSLWTITLAAAGLFLTVGMPYYLPMAGKEQHHLTPQFQVYEASFRPDIERARDKLNEARAGLPKRGIQQEFSRTQREVMLHLLSAYAAAGDMSIAQTQMTLFLTQMTKNLDHQQQAGLVATSEVETVVKGTTSSASKAMECAHEAHSRANILVKALSSSPSTDEGVAGLMRSVDDIKDLTRGKDHPSMCIETALSVRTQLAKVVDLHDRQVEAFNSKARRDAAWLKLAGALGAVLLFVYGRPATKNVSRLWRSWRNGRRRPVPESPTLR